MTIFGAITINGMNHTEIHALSHMAPNEYALLYTLVDLLEKYTGQRDKVLLRSDHVHLYRVKQSGKSGD